MQTAFRKYRTPHPDHTVGIGSNQAYALADTILGKRLMRAEYSLDVDLLQKLAALTGGSYFPAADAGGMAKVMQEIDALESTSREAPRYTSYRELAPLLALAAALILLTGLAAEIIRRPRLP